MAGQPVLTPRGNCDHCAACRKKFEPGDRVMPIYIVQTVGFNQATREFGAFLGEQFELMHAMCINPSLDGQIIRGG
jgi:hypothetical protein